MKVFIETDVNACLIARAESFSRGQAQSHMEPAEPAQVEDVTVVISHGNKETDITDHIPADLMSAIEDDLLAQHWQDQEIDEE